MEVDETSIFSKNWECFLLVGATKESLLYSMGEVGWSPWKQLFWQTSAWVWNFWTVMAQLVSKGDMGDVLYVHLEYFLHCGSLVVGDVLFYSKEVVTWDYLLYTPLLYKKKFWIPIPATFVLTLYCFGRTWTHSPHTHRTHLDAQSIYAQDSLGRILTKGNYSSAVVNWFWSVSNKITILPILMVLNANINMVYL